ncbi:hypothetical protein PIB30_111463, partial [Stylosanthes scabra]|nr:hypothetical protein [Stylosanthes scabra]
LTELDLSHNQLSGLIPDCWSQFMSLDYLDLSYNNFSGKIPTSLGSLGVQALRLRSNSLSEGIPSSMKNCTYLEILDMGENELSGHIPSWIGSTLKDLQMLSLQRNRFSGSLPSQICYLTSIQLLDLSSNNLSGQIPKCIKNFTLMAQETPQGVETYSHLHTITIGSETAKHYFDAFVFTMWKGSEQLFVNGEFFLLKGIDLSSNQFSGEIPAEIEDLHELIWLNLSRNNLTGEIPSKIGRLTSLEFLDLSRNQLSGEIPSSLTQIDRLAMLDVSHNRLSGTIPTGTQLQSFDASSYEDNLDLCGKPLEKLCIEAGEPQQGARVKFDEDEESSF